MKSPAFQFYPKDWLSSRRVRMMTAEQRGWYIQLLCEAWDSEIQGTLPNDPKLLWILAGASSEQVFNTCSGAVIDMFEKKGDSIFHNRLAEELAKQQHMSELRSKAGKESGKARRQLLKDKHLARMNTCSTSAEQEANTPSEQNTNTPSSIASASAIAFANTKRGVFRIPKPEEVSSYAKTIGYDLNGSTFIDHYTANGWMVGKSKMRDWRASVRTWKARKDEQDKVKNSKPEIKLRPSI